MASVVEVRARLALVSAGSVLDLLQVPHQERAAGRGVSMSAPREPREPGREAMDAAEAALMAWYREGLLFRESIPRDVIRELALALEDYAAKAVRERVFPLEGRAGAEAATLRLVAARLENMFLTPEKLQELLSRG